ncbi:MAG: segregation/condensation protein A [Candidatus Pacebacteria bacterium]|nr:segregation/condensation protein A [Candidatus Paceibacterota bacterium]
MEPSSETRTYEFQIGEFKGPLDKLLELIEAEKMDINSVSLAKVTDGFLHYLDDLKSAIGVADGEKVDRPFRADLHLLADFVAVASRLIFLKSKYLLPGLELTEEEEADIKDLETRLKIYQDLKPAIRALNKLWRESHRSYSRPYLVNKGTIFYPGANLTLEGLAAALDGIFENIKTYEMETDTIKERIVTLEEKISEVLARVQKEGDMHFKNLSGDKSRGETIVVFLALLHLAREQLVLLEQIDAFSDILVKKK